MMDCLEVLESRPVSKTQLRRCLLELKQQMRHIPTSISPIAWSTKLFSDGERREIAHGVVSSPSPGKTTCPDHLTGIQEIQEGAIMWLNPASPNRIILLTSNGLVR